jgi:hypothetical protein
VLLVGGWSGEKPEVFGAACERSDGRHQQNADFDRPYHRTLASAPRSTLVRAKLLTVDSRGKDWTSEQAMTEAWLRWGRRIVFTGVLHALRSAAVGH